MLPCLEPWSRPVKRPRINSGRDTARKMAARTSELDEGRGSRRTAAGKQSNISGNKNDLGRILPEDHERRGAERGRGCIGCMNLSVRKQRDRAFVVGIGGIAMYQGVQGRCHRHGLQRQKDAKQEGGSAWPDLSKGFHGEHWHHDM